MEKDLCSLAMWITLPIYIAKVDNYIITKNICTSNARVVLTQILLFSAGCCGTGLRGRGVRDMIISAGI